MIVTGAARSVFVKMYYQMGFVNPLFVTLLYLLGHALALVVYGVSVYWERKDPHPPVSAEGGPFDHNSYHNNNTLHSMISKSIHRTSLHDVIGALLLLSNHENIHNHPNMEHSRTTKSSSLAWSEGNDDSTTTRTVVTFWGMLPMGEFSLGRFATTPNGNQIEMIMDSQQQQHQATTTILHTTDDNNNNNNNTTTVCYTTHGSSTNTQASQPQWGSVAGLNDDSKRAVQWIHSIPWYYRPIIPGVCNLVKSALRWASLVYISASVAEIIISGLELVLSVLAARFIRQRRVALARWRGVGLVLFAIVLVGVTDLLQAQTNATPSATTTTKMYSTRDTVTGLLLILAQSIMSAIQEIAEEIFMEEANFPATLLLGMEGLLGLAIGLVLYRPIAPLFQEDPAVAWRQFTSSNGVMGGYGAFLVLLFLVNGIANILTTCATSSMTRNVWKNIRTVLVWVLGLLIFYIAAAATTTTSSTSSSWSNSLGEQWQTPKSFMTLLGFAIMMFGIHIYYRQPPTTTTSTIPTTTAVPSHNNIHSTVSSLHVRYDEFNHLNQQQQQHPPPWLSGGADESLTTTPTLQRHPPRILQDHGDILLEEEPTNHHHHNTNILTMASMTTEVHDNTIRHRPSPKLEVHSTWGGRRQHHSP
jgi:hypothetical protein